MWPHWPPVGAMQWLPVVVGNVGVHWLPVVNNSFQWLPVVDNSCQMWARLVSNAKPISAHGLFRSLSPRERHCSCHKRKSRCFYDAEKNLGTSCGFSKISLSCNLPLGDDTIYREGGERLAKRKTGKKENRQHFTSSSLFSSLYLCNET